MHSSRMRTGRNSSRLLGGVYLSACWDTLLSPPPCLGLDPLGIGLDPPLWAWTPPLGRPSPLGLGLGLDTPPARPPTSPLGLGLDTPLGLGLDTPWLDPPTSRVRLLLGTHTRHSVWLLTKLTRPN